MVGILIHPLTIALFAFVVIGLSNQFGIGFSTDIHMKTAIAFAFRFVRVIGLHAVQFGNNWMKTILRTAKIGLIIFFIQIFTKLDKHAACLLLII